MDRTPGPVPIYLLAGGRGSLRKGGDPSADTGSGELWRTPSVDRLCRRCQRRQPAVLLDALALFTRVRCRARYPCPAGWQAGQARKDSNDPGVGRHGLYQRR